MLHILVTLYLGHHNVFLFIHSRLYNIHSLKNVSESLKLLLTSIHSSPLKLLRIYYVLNFLNSVPELIIYSIPPLLFSSPFISLPFLFPPSSPSFLL